MATDTDNLQPERKEERANDTGSVWKRGLYMLVLAIMFSIGQTLLMIIAIFQFLSSLFSGHPNGQLSAFGGSLALWLADVAAFLAYATDDKPFPWDDWPKD